MKRILLFLLILSVICAAGKLWAEDSSVDTFQGLKRTRVRQDEISKKIDQGKDYYQLIDKKWAKIKKIKKVNHNLLDPKTQEQYLKDKNEDLNKDKNTDYIFIRVDNEQEVK